MPPETPPELRAALVEAMAREMFACCDGGDPDRLTRFAPGGGPAWTLYRSAASDTLAALESKLPDHGAKITLREQGDMLSEVKAAWLYVWNAAPTAPWGGKDG